MAIFPPPARVDRWTVLGVVCAIVIAIVWVNVSVVVAVRLWGMAIIGAAVAFLWCGRIPYGWEGCEPSGYITGGLAVFLNIVALAVGGTFMVVPEIIADMFEAPR